MSHVRTWHAEVFLFENGDQTIAKAALTMDEGNIVRASGTARRSPHDVAVPEIGDEIAVGRALGHLSQEMLRLAVGDIEGARR